MKENIIFLLVCSIAYIFLLCYDTNKDIERYFHNFDKPKYYMYIYVKYILFFVIIYNIKELMLR